MQARPSLKNPVHLLAFGFGAGMAPAAPGTVGTVIGLLIYLPLSLLNHIPYLLMVVVISLAGIWLCGITARDLDTHDHPGIVWDEIAGYLVTMVGAPPGWQWMILGFVLFRLFDIWKPWPIRPIDRRVGGGVGIMLDDVVAGVFAALCMQLVHMVTR